jgi:ubiquinone biosynthesis protein UbiJ
MIARVAALVLMCWLCGPARAQDIPGIEICTAERDLNRRTSCLQSNIEFLQRQMTKQATDTQQKLLDAQQKLTASAAEISSLKGTVDMLRARVEQLQAAAKTPPTK